MFEENGAFRGAFGAGSADVIGAEHLKHGGAREAGVLGEVDDRQCKGGQHQMMRHIERLRKKGGIAQLDRLHAFNGEDRDGGGKENDQHDASPEDGHGVAYGGEDRDEGGHDAIGLACGDDTEEDAKDDRNDLG